MLHSVMCCVCVLFSSRSFVCKFDGQKQWMPPEIYLAVHTQKYKRALITKKVDVSSMTPFPFDL